MTNLQQPLLGYVRSFPVDCVKKMQAKSLRAGISCSTLTTTTLNIHQQHNIVFFSFIENIYTHVINKGRARRTAEYSSCFLTCFLSISLLWKKSLYRKGDLESGRRGGRWSVETTTWKRGISWRMELDWWSGGGRRSLARYSSSRWVSN